MTRIGSHGSRSQSYMVNINAATATLVGSNTETLPTTAPNVPIVSDRSPMAPRKKMENAPLRTASCVFPAQRGRFLDSSPVLPERAPEAMNRPTSPTNSGTHFKKERYRAAERGRGNLLPTASFDLDKPRLRGRTASSGVGTTGGLRRATSGTPGASSSATTASTNGNSNKNASPSDSFIPQSLRNRRSTLQLHDDEPNLPIVQDTPVVGQRGVYPTWSDDFGKTDKPRRLSSDRHGHHSSDYYIYNHWSGAAANLPVTLKNMKRGQLVQALAMLAVACFVLDSYSKAASTTEQLLMVKYEESLMLLHLKRLEEQAMHLHESVTELSERGFDRMAGGGGGGSDSSAEHGRNVDTDLVKVQYDQLRQMEDELNHEVKSLQNKIRQTDRANIVRAFGEGPVQVGLEIDFGMGSDGGASSTTGSSSLSILLWYETPHAAWTLLNQIERGVWDGSRFEMDRGLAVVASPRGSDSENKRLEFVEKGQKMHEPWTVGLSESDTGELSLFINLQDNTQYHKHDVCIGKIIDGFDTLQRLTRAARNEQSGLPVSIRKATASHLARRDSAGLL